MTAPPEDFASFYAATWSRLLRTTYAITGDAQLAEDALQTGFSHAYASWGRVRAANDPVAYVRRVAVNAALAQRRRAFMRRELMTEYVPETAHAAGVELDDVWQVVQALPARQRTVIVLRYYEDLSEQQTAEAMGCRLGTVKSQASAALATLRRVLREQSPEGEKA
ncbi:SigE family RNA polymerase sigma factor [Nocardioides marinquilinus]|uniref:SigE family RNA polymerase sigma factor n=1 Tax=Nocardioides marinquilinus TaxID=1210400 RepID=A0ABP9PEL4_9ACTN